MFEVKLKNMVAIACKLKEFDQAICWVKKYKACIHKTRRDALYSFHRGIIAFYQSDYESALGYVGDQKIKSLNDSIEVSRRFLTLKIYYEKDKEYLLETELQMRSIERFFTNNNILTIAEKSGYVKFIAILINLYKVKHDKSRMKLNRIQDKLNTSKYNADKKWLQEKCDELRRLSE